MFVRPERLDWAVGVPFIGSDVIGVYRRKGVVVKRDFLLSITAPAFPNLEFKLRCTTYLFIYLFICGGSTKRSGFFKLK